MGASQSKLLCCSGSEESGGDCCDYGSLSIPAQADSVPRGSVADVAGVEGGGGTVDSVSSDQVCVFVVTKNNHRKKIKE